MKYQEFPVEGPKGLTQEQEKIYAKDVIKNFKEKE